MDAKNDTPQRKAEDRMLQMAQRLAQKTHGEEAHVREGELKRIFSEAKKYLAFRYFSEGVRCCPHCCGAGQDAVKDSGAGDRLWQNDRYTVFCDMFANVFDGSGCHSSP